MKKIILATISLITLLQAAPLGIVTHTEFGYVRNQGNTDDSTMTFDGKFQKDWDKHRTTTTLTGQLGREDNIASKNRWLLETQYDYKFSEYFAFNYILGYKRDKFTSFDYQLYTGPGAKYIALHSKTQTLSISFNGLYALDAKSDIYSSDGTNDGIIVKYPDSPTAGDSKIPGSGVDENYYGYRFGLEYSLQVVTNLKFIQEFKYRNSFEDTQNYFLYSKSGLSSKISDNLSAGISYSYDYVNTPEAGDENYDSVLTANLIIDY